MVYYSRRRATRKFYKKRAIQKKRVYRRRNAGLARRVRSIVNSMEETKQKTTTYTISFNSGITSTSEIYNIIPTLTKGDDSNQRQGDKIQPMWLKVCMIMKYGTGGSSVQPIHPHMFCLIDKNQRNSNNLFSTSYILNNGGTPTQFDGTWSNSNLPVDTEQFKIVKRKKFRLAYNTLPGGTATTVTDPNEPIWKEYSFKINLRKYTRTFDYSGSNTSPENLNLGLAFGYTRLDDVVDLTGTPLTIMFQSTLYYKDS